MEAEEGFYIFMGMHHHGMGGQYMRNPRKAADVERSARERRSERKLLKGYASVRHEMQKGIGNLDGSESPTTSAWQRRKVGELIRELTTRLRR
jgi:hypothetical protein